MLQHLSLLEVTHRLCIQPHLSIEVKQTVHLARAMMGIFCDRNNYIYVCEGGSSKLRKITQEGVVTTAINNDTILAGPDYVTIDN